MKILLLLSLIICVFSCVKTPVYYHGVVIDPNLKPLSNVKISLSDEATIFTTSNKDGYFKLKKDPDILSHLIFSKEVYKKDTVRTFWIQNTEQEDYMFLNKKADTLVLKNKIE